MNEPLLSDAQAIYRAAVRRVQADRLLDELDEHWLNVIREATREDGGRVHVVGMGKAAMAMAGALERKVEGSACEGVVVVPGGYPDTLPEEQHAPQHIEVMTGGHPVPDAGSQKAARRFLDVAGGCTEDDLLVVLISGGGTALTTAPAGGIPLDDARHTFQLLLESGADIHAMNAVRKHLACVGGGRLARAAAPARILALVVSDVVGNDLSTIASGPTVPDPTTYGEALDVLDRYGLTHEVPDSVRVHLEAGARGECSETAKPGDSCFERTETVLIGTNEVALDAARREAEERGYMVPHVTTGVTGEARDVAYSHVQAMQEAACQTAKPACLLWGGEPTVTVRGDGKGGRSQEVALAGCLAFHEAELGANERPMLMLAGGTDGIDGPTDAAGGWATPALLNEARTQSLDLRARLDNNDAYTALNRLGALLITGPTHTNVMDIHVALLGALHTG